MKPDISDHFMDKTTKPRKEPTEDETRESLIAISYGVPETDIADETSSKIIDGEKAATAQTPDRDGEEKYRSELISISCSHPPPPEVFVRPPLPQEISG
ncbi:hypothetical protein OROGR_028268 [Orobanche gracilis]